MEGVLPLKREQAISCHTSGYESDKNIKWGVFTHVAPCSLEEELLPNHRLSIDCNCQPVRDEQGAVIHNQ
jgi:hypothetical protein